MSAEVETVRAVEWTLDQAGRVSRSVTSLPHPAPGELLVASRIGAISPGTERTLLHGNSPSVPADAYPYQPGYLNVVEIRDATDRTLIGERGVAILGHRDHALIPYTRFIRIPSSASDEEALLGVLAADARHAIEIAAVEAGEDCLVIGGGILGVLTAWELAFRTKGAIRILERDPNRRALLGEIRFPAEVKVAEGPGRYEFHSVFECANTGSAFERAQASARERGSIVLISDGCHEPYVLSSHFFSKGLYLGKTDSNPDLRGFLGEYFARHEDRSSLIEVAYRDEVRFADFPQAYLQALMGRQEDRKGLLPRVIYGD
ncbi:MAG: zinc-binding dehydrogenase [Gemmatimonadota bacterium]|nr:MAG: zinc-binding dehydrogenase [Gemmatimonadota bacterium]